MTNVTLFAVGINNKPDGTLKMHCHSQLYLHDIYKVCVTATIHVIRFVHCVQY